MLKKNNKKKVNESLDDFIISENEEPTKKWYQEIPNDPSDFPSVPEEKWIQLKEEAKKCNDLEAAAYNIKSAKTNSEFQWMKTVMSKGTVADKVAAYTLLIQSDPVCNLSTLYNMISMVKVGKKNECDAVMETLTDLFLSDLLRPNCKLKPFYQRPHSLLDELTSGNVNTRRKYLSIWYFEDQLKEYYTSFVLAINSIAQDTVDANKEKAITAMCKLLVGNPEQEKNLLSNIVNKLGDPSQKIASKAIYCLGRVLYEHPAMKQVVLNEIERLLFRPNLSTKAQYYGICFLTQFCLSHDDFEIAKNLIVLYFSFFKACIKKGEVDSRMMSALLMGVNRAYPYAQTELDKISEHINTLYKIVRIATFNVSLYALSLLYQISGHELIQDRFYSSLYQKLADIQINSNKNQALFLNLVYRALKRDVKIERIRTFIKRLLQLSLYGTPALSCAILYLIQQVIKGNRNLYNFETKTKQMVQPENKEDEEDDKDEEMEEILQNLSQESNKSNGILLNTTIKEVVKKKDLKENNDKISTEIESSCVDKVTVKTEYNHPEITEYKPFAINPLYAGGQFCNYTELIQLQNHFHPTVALFANQILNAQNIMYSGDPLKDFTLIKFLERFSFKNPKKLEDMQKKKVNPIFGKRHLMVSTGVKALSINSAAYLSLDKNKIPVEELFMYNYLHEKQEAQKKMKQEEEDSDLESVASEEFEEMLDRMGTKDMDDEDLDFMNDIGETLKNQEKDEKQKNLTDDSEDDDIDDDDDNLMEDDDDDEIVFSGDEEMDDEDVEAFNENDDEESDFDDHFDSGLSESEEDDSSHNKKQQKTKKKKKLSSEFVSADEFAELLDEEPDFMAGSSNAVSNKDNAHLKQLKWEQNRNRWIKGFNNKKAGKKGNNFKNKQNFGKKRQKPQQQGHKNKKFKK